MLLLSSQRADVRVHFLSGPPPPAASALGVRTLSGLLAVLKVLNNGQRLRKREKAEDEDSSLSRFGLIHKILTECNQRHQLWFSKGRQCYSLYFKAHQTPDHSGHVAF